MRKSYFTIAVLFILFSVVPVSCNKDDDDLSASGDASATYELVMNSNNVAAGTSTNKVMQYGTTINMGGTGSELVITITNVPVSTGGTIEINQSSGTNGDQCQLTISGTDLIKNGEDEIYWGISGTVTRTSETKISFTGVCKEDASATITHTFSGHIESDAYKVNYKNIM